MIEISLDIQPVENEVEQLLTSILVQGKTAYSTTYTSYDCESGWGF